MGKKWQKSDKKDKKSNLDFLSHPFNEQQRDTCSPVLDLFEPCICTA